MKPSADYCALLSINIDSGYMVDISKAWERKQESSPIICPVEN